METKAIAILKHPNIVQLYDVIKVDSMCYLVLELCEHGTLEK